MTLSQFRPIQYIGNKSRLLDDIERQVGRLAPDSRPAVCDLFAGTGVVTRRLARSRPVLASDVQHYSRVLTSAQCRPYRFGAGEIASLSAGAAELAAEILRSGTRPLAELESAAVASAATAQLVEIVECGSIAAWIAMGGHQRDSRSAFEQLLTRAAKGLMDAPYACLSTYYGGVYFSYQQAAYLDAATYLAHGLPDEARDTAVAAVLSTASQLVASVGGHFAQPMRVTTKAGALKRPALTAVARSRQASAASSFRDWLTRWSRLEPSVHPVTAVQADFREVVGDLPRDIGLVYADPPYTRDHYSRFYHVLETIALADDPGLSRVRLQGRDVPSRGLYRVERHQSPFSIVREAPHALDLLCSALAARSTRLLLSYSPIPDTEKPRDRVMTLKTILDVVSSHFSRVEVFTAAGIGHSKFNAARLNAPTTYGAEVLVACSPR